jgi:hypothetical protein
MKKKVAVARTAYDLTHVNRLGVPEFSIVRLAVTATGHSSKTYWPAWAYTQAGGGAGSDDFHFCPEKETAAIEYQIDDPFALAGEAKLELFWRFKERPIWTLHLDKIGEDTFIHGKHSLNWDGRVVKPSQLAGTDNAGVMEHDLGQLDPNDGIEDDFPDGYITLDHTPYKLKLTLIDRNDSDQIAVAWTYFQVIVKSFDFELGPVGTIPSAGIFSGARHNMDKAVHAAVLAAGGIQKSAAGAAPTRIPLVSNLFKYTKYNIISDGSEMDDNTGYDVYKDLWDGGPRLPVFALIRLAASDDSEVKCELGPGAKALGKTHFLWDWVDQRGALGTPQSQAAPAAFLTPSINYYQATTKPIGFNCHVDVGGKRGPKAEPIFPEQGGYSARDTLKDADFPFKVDECSTRKWAVFSQAWTKGALKGKTGVLFRPSRMAGDVYKLAIYAAWDRSDAKKFVLDKEDLPLTAPPAIMAETRNLEVWREIHIARYYRKQTAAIADFVTGSIGVAPAPAAGTIKAPYSEAFIDVVNKMGPGDNTQLPAARYNAVAGAALQATGNAMITNQLMALTGANHAGTASEFLIETFAAFRTNVQNWLAAQFPAAPNPAALAATWLTNHGYAGAGGQAAYGRDARAITKPPGKKILDDLQLLDGANEGVTIVQFNYQHQLDAMMIPGGTAIGTFLTGAAVNITGSTRNKCCFGFWQAGVGTFVHEIGHHLFLPHAPFGTPGNMPSGSQPERHDALDPNCLMSYTPATVAFCGLCQLRLRGWDAGPNDPAKAKLKKNAAQNQKV